MANEHIFNGRKVVIATKHQKEQVIGPALQEAFGMEYIVSEKLDTDLLGTFTGEVERVLTPVEAARQKCILALSECDADFAIGSEGSFGPHPTLYFLPADEEILLLVDRKRELEIVVKQVSMKTNYASFEQGAEQSVADFLQQIKDLGYKIALGSASKNAEIILEKTGLMPWFDLIIDGNKVSKSKPDPEVFLKGAEGLGLSPETCIVFEDAQAGVEAAKAGKMKAIGIGEAEMLGEADKVIPSFVGIQASELLQF